MNKEVVEVAFPLKRQLIYYHDMLQKHGLKLVYTCTTHDLYFSKDTNFDGMTEKQIKDKCIRLRTSSDIISSKSSYGTGKEFLREKELIYQGYTKVFDTIKFDFHYHKEGMTSRIQLQDILNLGLLVYYDNADYYGHPPEQQRKLLIEELNSYGFNFKQTDLCLDKLRTFYYGKKMYSANVNA